MSDRNFNALFGLQEGNHSNNYSLEGIIQFLNQQYSLMKSRDQEMLKEKSALSETIKMLENEYH